MAWNLLRDYENATSVVTGVVRREPGALRRERALEGVRSCARESVSAFNFEVEPSQESVPHFVTHNPPAFLSSEPTVDSTVTVSTLNRFLFVYLYCTVL